MEYTYPKRNYVQYNIQVATGIGNISKKIIPFNRFNQKGLLRLLLNESRTKPCVGTGHLKR